MRRFTQLYMELDRSNRTSDKLAALRRYFADAPPEDAAWGLYFLSGRKIKRAVNTARLRDWVAAESGLPLWLVEESYDAVGDLAETLALLLPEATSADPPALHQIVDQQIARLPKLDLEQQEQLVRATWRQLDTDTRFVWNKLIVGQFRVGVAATLVSRALAEVAGVEPAVMAHRLMGNWEPSAEAFERILAGDDAAPDPGQPYPFFLAHPLEVAPHELGALDTWQAEWKWDGIRAQLIHRASQVLVWSRGEELMTDRFPELRAIGNLLPSGTVLDGEVLAWRDGTPLSFGVLQTRIGRKRITQRVLNDAPVAFMAYDLLECRGEDIRPQSLAMRRSTLEQMLRDLGPVPGLHLSPVVDAQHWDDVVAAYQQARQHRAEGLMLKSLDAAYGVGRTKGMWWKWKAAPLSVDAVLVYAQQGHGRRASLYSDYTFAVWNGGELVPIAKAYSGLTDAEMREVDAFIRSNTLDRFGPVRVVKPELVFELHFEGIQESTRHKAGLAVRFPRMARWRHDKLAAEADTLDTMRALLHAHGNEVGS